jgi:two-component sensor histidine kinase
MPNWKNQTARAEDRQGQDKETTMLMQAKRLLAPPVFEDEDKTRKAGLLNTILLAALALTVISIVIDLLTVPNPVPGLIIESILILLELGILLLMRHGQVKVTRLLHLATRSLNDVLERARLNASALAESNRELETTHALLEEHADELSRANERLQREIAGRNKAEAQIKVSLKEKEVLLQEIHHRVKNNLQVISSLLNLLSDYVGDQQALKIIQESQNRVRSMALIHEKLYQSQDLARIDFAEYIRNLAAYLFGAYSANAQAISLKVQADDVFLTIDTAIPCGLILNEMISNALKHAFPDGQASEIRVEFCVDHDHQCTLEVRDNGVGLPPDLDFRTTESSGLQLVNTLVEQLDGTIELDSSSGTEFKIVFAASQGGNAHDQSTDTGR